MNRVELAKQRQVEELYEWIDATGIAIRGTSYASELGAIVEAAFDAGYLAAMGDLRQAVRAAAEERPRRRA